MKQFLNRSFDSLKLRATYLLLTACFSLSACNWLQDSKDEFDEIPVARVFDKNLYPSDLSGVVGKGIAPNDSAEIAQVFIDNWIRENLLVQRAELNMNTEIPSIEKQVENYRNSLLIYLYEKELMEQRMDTSISETEIAEYYKEAREDFFELNTNIVRLLYLKIPEETPQQDSIKKWLTSDNPVSREKLEDYCYQYSTNYHLDDSTWLLLEDVKSAIPFNFEYNQYILTQQGNTTFTDSVYKYYLNILDYRVKENIAPLSYVKDDIRKIILNKRQMEFSKNLRNEAYEEGIKNNYFEIY